MHYRHLFVAAMLGLSACSHQVLDVEHEIQSPGQGEAMLFPLPDRSSILTTIAFGSCADEELPQPIWSVIAAEKPDLFLFVGDNVYADRNRGEMVEEFTRAELEFAYGLLSRHPDFSPFRAQTPMLATWDDHDFGKNDGGVEFSLKADAKELMLETLGMPQDEAMPTRPGVYHSAYFGEGDQLLQVIMLDTRWFRSSLKDSDEPGTIGKERYVPDSDPTKTMLGDAQWAWLAAELRKPAALRLLVSSIQVIADGHGWEAWRTMPHERERLYELIRQTGSDNMVILSGDRHVGGLYQTRLDGNTVLSEITSSSLNLPWTLWNPGKDRVEETGPYQVGDLVGHENYGVLSVDWSKRAVKLDLNGPDGSPVRTLDVAF